MIFRIFRDGRIRTPRHLIFAHVRMRGRAVFFCGTLTVVVATLGTHYISLYSADALAILCDCVSDSLDSVSIFLDSVSIFLDSVSISLIPSLFSLTCSSKFAYGLTITGNSVSVFGDSVSVFGDSVSVFPISA